MEMTLEQQRALALARARMRASEEETVKRGDANQGTAAARGLVSGIPVVGPSLLRGLENVGAGAESLISGKSSDEELARIRSRGAASDKEYPGTRLGGDLAGGVLGTVPLVAAAPAAFGAGAGSMVARMGASAASGAGLGGLDAGVRGGLDAALPGAAIGGAAGAAGPVAMGIGQGVFRAGAGALANLPGRVGEAAAKYAGNDRVAQALLNSGKDGGGAITDAMEQARVLGKGDVYTLADAMGPTGAKATGTAQRGPGPGHDRVVEALLPRQRAQSERLIGDLDDAFATGGTAKQESKRLLQKARDDSRELYAQARERPLESTARLDQFMRDPEVRAGVAKGAEIERLEDLASGKAPAHILEGAPEPAPRANPLQNRAAPPEDPRAEPTAPIGKPEKRPETMAEFIARGGGIELDADFKHAGLDKFRVRTPDGKFTGNVARKGGHSLDGYWRVKLQEEGFLPKAADGYMNDRDIRGEVTDLLLMEQMHKQPRFRASEAGAQEAWEGARNEARNAEALLEHLQTVRKELVELGVPERSINKAALDEAALASRRGEDGVQVYERLLERGMPDAAPVAPGEAPPAMAAAGPGEAPDAFPGPAAPAGPDAPASLPAASEPAKALTQRELQQARIGLGAEIEKERDAIKGLTPKGRALLEVKKALDVELESVNPDLLAANRTYAGPMGQRDAIEKGKAAAKGGQPADNIDTFRGLPAADEQQGFRQGYVEPHKERLWNLKGRAPDAAREFSSPKTAREIPEFAFPGRGDQFRDRLALETRMSDTKAGALGNSTTADKLADDAAPLMPGVLEALLRGKPGQAALAGTRAGLNAATGNTGAVRDRVAEVLMRTAAEGGEGIVDELTAAGLKRRDIAALIYQSMIGGGRGAAGAP